MKRDLPIPFMPAMIRALLAERKTKTRRVVDQSAFRDGPDGVEVWTGFMGWQTFEWAKANRGACGKGTLPPHVGVDLLWVREAWRTLHANDCLAPRHLAEDRRKITYEADPENRNPLWAFGRLRAGMHMPRWASRLTLIITDVRVERLQDISEADAIAEGCSPVGQEFLIPGHYLYTDPSKARTARTAVSAFQSLWNCLNDERGYGWDANPWVAATTFEVVHGNIDEIGDA